MKNRSGEKIKLASIDELLGVVNEESAMEIEISKIHPFKNHPFKVLDDEKMQDLVESVRINGVRHRYCFEWMIMKNMKWYPVIEECMQHSLQDLRLFRQS